MDMVRATYSVESYYLYDDGIFPNNKQFPVVIYRNVLNLPEFFPALSVRNLFAYNHWGNSWKDGVYTYHHYHSNTFEVLGIFNGKAQLLFGGDSGIKIRVKKGDVIIIPPGVAHKNLNDKDDISCVGAYPGSKEFDIHYGKPGERPQTGLNVRKVMAPATHPLFGLKQIKEFKPKQ
jgi:uncharacterized protein YjlB